MVSSSDPNGWISAQHEETGYLWHGYRKDLPRRYFEIPNSSDGGNATAPRSAVSASSHGKAGVSDVGVSGEPVARTSNQCAAYGCQNKRNDGQFVGDYCGPCDSALRYGTATFGTSFIFQQQREIERLKTELGMRPAVCVCEPFCSRRNPKCPRCSTHETLPVAAPSGGHTVFCDHCDASALLPYTDATKSSVAIGPMQGWNIETRMGVMCPKCASKKAFESQLPASRVTIPMPAVKAPRVIEPPLACDSFERDPHSVFCNKCGYPSREHGKSEGDQRG